MFRLQTTVSREGWFYMAIVLIVFGGAVSKEVNLLLILAGMLFCPVLINWRAVRSTLRGLRVERQLPLRSSAGEMFSVGLSLANTRPRLSSWAVLVEEQICPERSGAKNHHQPAAAAAPQRALSLRAGRASRPKAATAVRSAGAAAIVSGPCG